MKNTFRWASDYTGTTFYEFEDGAAGDTENDEITWKSCVISMNYTETSPKYMCFWHIMQKNTTASSGQNPTYYVDVKETTTKSDALAYTSWTTTGVANGTFPFPAITANSVTVGSEVTHLCAALQ